MKKHCLSVLIYACLALSFEGCTSVTAPADPVSATESYTNSAIPTMAAESPSPTAVPDPVPTVVPEDTGTVPAQDTAVVPSEAPRESSEDSSLDFTIPKSLASNSQFQELKEEILHLTDTQIEEDDQGDVILTMTESVREQILTTVKESVDQQIKYLVENEDICPSFSSISYSEDLSVFDIYVNPEEFNSLEGLYVLSFYSTGSIYQILEDIPVSQVTVNVNFKDETTGETLELGDPSEPEHKTDPATTVTPVPQETVVSEPETSNENN